MIGPETIATGARISAELRILRAEESWIPALFGGLIPVIGGVGVFWLIHWAVKDPPEGNEDLPEDEEPPPSRLDDDGHEGPLS